VRLRVTGLQPSQQFQETSSRSWPSTRSRFHWSTAFRHRVS